VREWSKSGSPASYAEHRLLREQIPLSSMGL
jgi:hypothetical protein